MQHLGQMLLTYDELCATDSPTSLSLLDLKRRVLVKGKVKPPKAMVANYDDGQLLLVFAVEPAQPVKLEGSVKVGIYDPTMYTAIDFVNDDDLVVTGPDAGKCGSKVVRPDPDEVIAENQASLTDAFFNDPAGTDLSKLFATRIELDCK